jgi:hypothetical protein
MLLFNLVLFIKESESCKMNGAVLNSNEFSFNTNMNDTRRNGQPPKSQPTKKSTWQKVNLIIK